MQIVDDHCQIALPGGKRLDQGHDPVFEIRAIAIAPHQQRRVAHHFTVHHPNACQQATEEAREFVVFRGEREPSDIEIKCQQRLPQRHQAARLATAGRALQNNATLAPRIEEALM
ncbi:hypothetical protein [Cupriavidus necator]|uniref:hypothetical protein n=1 Tax=Cupriavidus necator TaxID=106590 RepID=UPI001EE660C3|nr:hypothetical protein [Cupriavidus necator]MDX6007537.1 hypothetical protein [Cupriavidus necator]